MKWPTEELNSKAQILSFFFSNWLNAFLEKIVVQIFKYILLEPKQITGSPKQCSEQHIPRMHILCH